MQKMLLKISAILIFFTLIILGIRLVNAEQLAQVTEQNQMTVTTSFYPLYFFTKEIVGDKVEVINLTKTGNEPHDYEPSPRDIKIMENSKLLVVNGNSFESWLAEFGEQIGQTDTQILRVAENSDPHLWLDPVLAQEQVRLITVKLQEIDPSNAVFYEKNSKILIQKLVELDAEFRTGLSECKENKIITSHSAFAYLAERYGLRQISIQGLNPDEDSSPAKIAATIDLVKENQIKYVFTETLVSPKIAETIAKESGAKILVFNPIEGLSEAEEKSGQDYFSIHKANLASLRLALECK